MQGLTDVRRIIRLRDAAYALLLAAGLGLLLSYAATHVRTDVPGTADLHAVPAFGAQGLKALTEGPHMDGFGAWSPDGKQLAFMRDGKIWLMGAGGGEQRGITRTTGVWDAAPAWRPDSAQIAFVRRPTDGQDAGSSRLMVLDPRTGGERMLALEKRPVGYIAYTPDGSTLYYTTADALMRLNPGDQSSRQVLVAKPGWDMLAGGLTISPDGKSAIFGAGPSDDRHPAYDLWLLDLSGKLEQPQRLTQTGGIMPALDRTGRRLVYRNPRESTGIYLMELNARQPTQIVADTRNTMYFHPSFAPDGKTLSLSELTLAEEGAQGAKFRSHIYVMPAPR